MPKLNDKKETVQANSDQNQQELTILATEINTHIRESEKHTAEAVKYACKAGEALLKAKKQIKHGQWLKWLKENCECSPRQAERYMNIAEFLSDPSNSTRASNLSQRKLLGLIAEAQAKEPLQNDHTTSPGNNFQQDQEGDIQNLFVSPEEERQQNMAEEDVREDREDGSEDDTSQDPTTGLDDPELDNEIAVSSLSPTMQSVPRVKSPPSKSLDRYLTFAVGTPEAKVLDDFEAEVRKMASKRSAKLVTKAMKTKNLGAGNVAAELLVRLSQRLIQSHNAS